jgi:ABC-2 type transport system ATP-binding protein
MILIDRLTKAYGTHRVLDGLTCEVRAGEVTLLVGANGSGKSTTLRIAAGMSTPTAGRVIVGGHDVARAPGEALAQLSYLPQAPRFHPHLSVRQILRFYARLRGRGDADVTRVLRQWALLDRADAPTKQLSGGLRQRLALAVFSLPEAPVLVLDEPGLSLDPDWRRALQAALLSAARDGRTVLVATHLLGEWEGQVDRCLVLEHGTVRRELPPDGLRQAFPFASGQAHGGPAAAREAAS